MWTIESRLADAGAPYDRKAAIYDRMVRSTIYNRIAWGTTPADYERFAADAFGAADGSLLEAAAGSAAATAELHACSPRPTVLVDLSRAMLERAGRRIAAANGDGVVPEQVRLVQADLLALPWPAASFSTVLGLGLLHLFDDLAPLLAALGAQLSPGGELYVAGLVAETRRGRRYLELLHRADEVASPRTAEQLYAALGSPQEFRTVGCMAFARLPVA